MTELSTFLHENLRPIPGSTHEAKTPAAAGFFQPAEWSRHDACWLAWPSHADLWKEDLKPAQVEFEALCRAICDVEPALARARGESLDVLVPNASSEAQARIALAGLPVRFHTIPFGDIWLRDTAPIFLLDNQGDAATARFTFNGWGGKYDLPGDDELAGRIAETAGHRRFTLPFVLEGGSIDVDGEGTGLTTRQCLLNANRNPELNEAAVETGLREALGLKKILWLGDGLLNDHTDGHIDTIARFVAPGKVVCMKASDPEHDPNYAVLETIAEDLARFSDAQGRSLSVVRIPSPGEILSADGRILPASYLNFYIANSTVVVPTYGSRYDAEAVAAIAELFPTRKTVGVSAIAILTGGGAFHCITQQQPAKGIYS